MDNLCLKITNQDRLGLVFDISGVLLKENINIISMEVAPDVMYLEIEPVPANDYPKLQDKILTIPDVKGVEPISHMPHMEKAQQLRTVMNSISDGLIAIDQKETIKHFNPVAQSILGYQAQEVLGRNISDILGEDIPLLKALHNGKDYNNKEIAINTPKGKSHYISSGRAIKDDKGIIIGAVAVMKAIGDVRHLIDSVTKPNITAFDDILYVSEVMQQSIRLARLVAQSDSTVLIRGESGTGKELFARAIHGESLRRQKTFAPINCAAITDTLLESELFGYEEGAFTGSKKGGKQGLFEYADGGTLFFDEIGELSANLQAKLLRVLQEGKIRRIGGNQELPVNVRIIAATHCNLEEMIRRNVFREDLYYRLNVIPIHIPPLRLRKEDVPLLVQNLALKISHRLNKTMPVISQEAMAKLVDHSWPGNVRELANVIERATSLSYQGEISPEHIILDQESFSLYPATLTPVSRKLKDVLTEVERQILQETIKKHGTSREVGKVLGLSHTGVLSRMKKYKLRK